MATKVQLINGSFQDSMGNIVANGSMTLQLNQDGQVSGVGQVSKGVVVTIPLDSNGKVLGTSSPFTLTAVAISGGVATYTGTITGGVGNAYVGISMVITGFAIGGNNGTFVCTGSTLTTLTFATTTQGNETHAGSAAGGTQFVWGNDSLSPVNSFYYARVYTSTGELVWGPNAQQITGVTPFDLDTWVPNLVSNWTPATTFPTLQTNESNNGSQSILDLHAGSGISLVDNGSGRVTIATTGLPLNFQGSVAAKTGNAADQVLYTFTLPAMATGAAIRVKFGMNHSAGTASVAYKLLLNGVIINTISVATTGVGFGESIIEAASTTTIGGASVGGFGVFSTWFLALANTTGFVFTGNQTLSLTFNVANTDQVAGLFFLVELIQL